MKNAAHKMRRTHSNASAGEIDCRSRVLGRGSKRGRRFDLKTLRTALGKTQADVAEAARMAQGDVSRLEGRDDVKFSTLVRYAHALGGSVEVTIVIDGRRYVLDLSSGGKDTAKGS